MGGRRLFLGSPVPPPFSARRVVLAAGEERPYDEADWADAIVLVERGEVELECSRGGRRRFESGSVLWFQGLPLRAIRCIGQDAAVLFAVSRRRSDEFPVGGPSDSERNPQRPTDVAGETEMTDETKDPR
ncbi:MAG TPA: hypothetical protein VD769_04755 [Gaiellaceae bacterium]|nr:hypothetical protein [Gaiellaceae bacterium]